MVMTMVILINDDNNNGDGDDNGDHQAGQLRRQSQASHQRAGRQSQCFDQT